MVFISVFDSLDELNDFTEQVVVSRRDTKVSKWTNWLREDLGSGPYAWLRPDFVPPSPSLVVKDPFPKTSRILVEPHLIDAEFRKAWMHFFCRSGHPVVTVDQFLDCVLLDSVLGDDLRHFNRLYHHLRHKEVRILFRRTHTFVCVLNRLDLWVLVDFLDDLLLVQE